MILSVNMHSVLVCAVVRVHVRARQLEWSSECFNYYYLQFTRPPVTGPGRFKRKWLQQTEHDHYAALVEAISMMPKRMPYTGASLSQDCPFIRNKFQTMGGPQASLGSSHCQAIRLCVYSIHFILSSLSVDDLTITGHATQIHVPIHSTVFCLFLRGSIARDHRWMSS